MVAETYKDKLHTGLENFDKKNNKVSIKLKPGFDNSKIVFEIIVNIHVLYHYYMQYFMRSKLLCFGNKRLF